MRSSLRQRLFAALGGTLLAGWLATAAFSYLDARGRIGEMLDGHLVQAATLIVTAAGEAHDPTPRAPVHWGEGAHAHALVFQRWSEGGELLFRSADAPTTPLGLREAGFEEVERAGERWRVFGLRTPDGGRVQVAEHAAFRDELAASVASHLWHPLVIALPLLAVFVWLSVRWALGPLRAIAVEVERRAPGNLAPLEARDAPSEVAPLVDALDALLLRVAASVEQERRFTADAAHELRTPLAAVRTHAEVALGARDEGERTRALTHVGEGIGRASRLVEELLVLARLDARSGLPQGRAVALRALAAEQVADAAPFASDCGINLGLAEGTEAFARGDSELLAVLLRNLVDNAVRYTPRGGRVDVAVAQRSGRAVLSVADTGPGIAPEERARVLERFHRGRASSEEGSGLGLSIVARIAELHGAELVLGEGLDGRGLSVCVLLPEP